MFNKSKTGEYKDIVRFPLRLHVAAIEFGPAPTIEIVRSSYDLYLMPQEMKQLHDWLGEKLEKEPYSPQQVRVIGMLES